MKRLLGRIPREIVWDIAELVGQYDSVDVFPQKAVIALTSIITSSEKKLKNFLRKKTSCLISLTIRSDIIWKLDVDDVLLPDTPKSEISTPSTRQTDYSDEEENNPLRYLRKLTLHLVALEDEPSALNFLTLVLKISRVSKLAIYTDISPSRIIKALLDAPSQRSLFDLSLRFRNYVPCSCQMNGLLSHLPNLQVLSIDTHMDKEKSSVCPCKVPWALYPRLGATRLRTLKCPSRLLLNGGPSALPPLEKLSLTFHSEADYYWRATGPICDSIGILVVVYDKIDYSLEMKSFFRRLQGLSHKPIQCLQMNPRPDINDGEGGVYQQLITGLIQSANIWDLLEQIHVDRCCVRGAIKLIAAFKLKSLSIGTLECRFRDSLLGASLLHQFFTELAESGVNRILIDNVTGGWTWRDKLGDYFEAGEVFCKYTGRWRTIWVK